MFEMKVGKRGLELCKKWEGCMERLPDGRYIAYLDTLPRKQLWSPGYRGLWTIGYGATGPDVTKGTVWTKSKCDSDLLKKMNQKAKEINAYLTVRVNQNQFDALCCAAYNLGTHGMRGILDLVNAGDFDAAGKAFLRYNHAGGKVVRGLTRRRQEERELFEWETPKEIKKLSKPVAVNDAVQTTAVGTGFSIAGLWQYLPQVRDFMTDHAGMILLGCLGIVLGINWLNKRFWHIEFNKGTYVPEGTKLDGVLD